MREKLDTQLSQFYSGLNPATGYPTTFMDVSLGRVAGQAPAYPRVRAGRSGQAGGLKEDAHLPAARFLRQGWRVIIDFDRAIRRGSKKADIPLMAGDQIMIPPAPHVVAVQGEVSAPGLFRYVQGFRAGDYISQAGGLTEKGDRNSVYVEMPTGIARKVKGSGPRVDDGSVIRVGVKPPKKEGEPMDWTEFTKEAASILASLATMIFVISRARLCLVGSRSIRAVDSVARFAWDTSLIPPGHYTHFLDSRLYAGKRHASFGILPMWVTLGCLPFLETQAKGKGRKAQGQNAGRETCASAPGR